MSLFGQGSSTCRHPSRLAVVGDALAHKRVLAHEHDGFRAASPGRAKRVHSLGQCDVRGRDETKTRTEKIARAISSRRAVIGHARCDGARPRSSARPALGLYERHRVSTHRTNVHELLGANVIGVRPRGRCRSCPTSFAHALRRRLAFLSGRSGRHDQSAKFSRELVLSHGGTKYCFCVLQGECERFTLL